MGEIRTVGVVGCGLMGAGIAQVCAEAGLVTRVREVNDDLLGKGLSRIERQLAIGVRKKKITEEEKEKILGNLHGTTDLAEFADCDLAIEAIVENLDAKKQIYGELDRICPEKTIFASNTSSLTITEMAAATDRPDRFAGLHFFNPVPIMQLVEVVKTEMLADEPYKTLLGFARAIGKTAITAPDTPGFIVNRLLVPYMLDAIRMLETGTATREDIDNGMKLGCGHPMGPLTLTDFVGLDTSLYIADIMFDAFKDTKFAAPHLLRRMVSAGKMGRKSGAGFYDYGGGKEAKGASA